MPKKSTPKIKKEKAIVKYITSNEDNITNPDTWWDVSDSLNEAKLSAQDALEESEETTIFKVVFTKETTARKQTKIVYD